MTYAIIETGGKQLRVEAGRFYDIDLLPASEGDQISIDNVLLVQHDSDVHIGQPLVEGALVEGTVMKHLRGKKIIVYKMRPKKKTRKKRGHRQELTRLMIDSISLNGKILASEEKSPATEVIETVTETTTEPTEVVETVETPTPETTAEVVETVETPIPDTTAEVVETVETPTSETTAEVVETVETPTSETTAEVETASEEKPENQAE